MTVFFDFDRVWPAVLHGVAKSRRKADPRVSRPRKDHFAGTASADHLVVNQIGSQTNQRQIATALPDDFMSCSERNKVTEAFSRNGIAVVNEFKHGFGESTYFGHTPEA